MNRYEELKAKQKAALIVVCTGGLASVPIALNWRSNIFEGTSFDRGPMSLFFKVLSFLLLTAIIAIPSFIIHLVSLIVTTVQLSNCH
ncbi:MAG: hypothetical protein IJR26_07485 [Bacteroidales bacterium]|nr:hypothetical protein [Bacteroidales bacterium]